MTLGLLGAAISNVAALEPPSGLGTITKDFDGQWFFEDFNRGDSSTIGNGWTEIGTFMEIASERLATDGGLGQIYQDFAILPNAICQMNFIVGAGNSLGEIAIRTDVGGDNDERQKIKFNLGTQTIQMIVRTGGVNRVTFNVNTAINPGNEMTLRLCVIDDGTYQIKGYKKLPGDIDDLTATLTEIIDEIPSVSFEPDQTEQRAYIAMFGNTTPDQGDNFFGCGRSIYIDGLSTGFKARLISAGGEIVPGSSDGGTGSLVEEINGKIQFEVSGTALPLNMIEVTNASDELVGTFNSGSGIWGGDSYSFTP